MKLTSSRAAKARTEQKTQTRPAPPPKKKGGKKGFVVPVVILVVILAAAVAGMIYVGAVDTVFPNVYVDGKLVGGMTQEAAASVLRSSGYEAGANNVRAEISLPNNTVLTITGEEAGMRLDAGEAAERAYAIGRDSNIFKACVQYVSARLGTKTELDAGDIGDPDMSAIREKAQPLVSAINEELAGNTYELTDTTIELYKGAGGVLASLDDVCRLAADTLITSLREKTPAVTEYTMPVDKTDGGIDFDALLASVYKEAVSAEYDPETQGVTQSVVGVSFDVAIARAQYASAVTGELVRIQLEFTQPEVSSEELSSMLFRDVLSENTTTIAGSSNRLNNIKLASAAVNGYVMNSGDTFSYNEVVGERTTEKGYLSAGAYAGGRTVQEVGGGICQVSSAIYDCTLYADLEVVERRNHQFTVAYLPLGNDATVNWGTTDYKFKNDTDYPIRIEISIDGRKMTTRFIGTKLTTETIEIKYTVLSTRAYTTTEIEDESVPEGTTIVDNAGSNGCTVETYKYRYDEHGNLLDKTYIAKSSYNAQTKIVLVPVGYLTSPSPDESPDVTPGESPDVTPPDESPSETTEPTDEPSTPAPTDDQPVVNTETPPAPTESPDDDSVPPTPDSTPEE